MAFNFDQTVVAKAQAKAAEEGFTSMATLKKNDAFSKVEESFAKRMKGAGIGILKLIISIPEPKTYDYAVTPNNKGLKGEDCKFVWQILRGTNSYRKGVPKWNMCTITVVDGKIKNVEFKQIPALLKKFRAVLKASKPSNEDFLETVEDLQSFYATCEELDANMTESVRLQAMLKYLAVAPKHASAESLEVARFFTDKLCGATKPSVESVGEKIAGIWTKVKNWVVGVFSKIGAAFSRLLDKSVAQKARNDTVLTLCRSLSPEQFVKFMQQTDDDKFESSESMSVAEMFASKCIISVAQVENLLRDALNVSTAVCVDKDIEKYRRIFRDIDNMSAAEGETYINSIGEELDQKLASLAELAEHEKHKFYEIVLKSGDNYKTLYDAGWKDVATVEKVFKTYDNVWAKLHSYRMTIDANIKQLTSLLTKIGNDLDPDDMLFARKTEILKSVVRLEIIRSRSVGTSLAYSIMIIEKCRGALARAIAN